MMQTLAVILIGASVGCSVVMAFYMRRMFRFNAKLLRDLGYAIELAAITRRKLWEVDPEAYPIISPELAAWIATRHMETVWMRQTGQMPDG